MNSINQSNEISSKERIKLLKKEKHNVFFSALKEGGIAALKAAGIFLPGILYSFATYPLFFPKDSRDLPRDTKLILIDWAKWTGITMAALGIGGAVGEIHNQVSYNKDIDQLVDEELKQGCAAEVAAHNQKHTKRCEQEKAVKAAALSSSLTPAR